MMKHLLAVLTLVVLSLGAATPALGQSTDGCPHEATIASLEECVRHASEQGVIDNPGITQSLLARLDAAQSALDRGQPAVSVNALEAFTRELNAQSGKHVAQPHAEHLLSHAQLVIKALEG